jgi:hypothetical protein
MIEPDCDICTRNLICVSRNKLSVDKKINKKCGMFDPLGVIKRAIEIFEGKVIK